MIWEILDNGIDEHLAGFCNELHLTLLKDGGVVVEDNGRGVPVDIHPTKKIPTARVVYTVLHAGGKFNSDVYKVSGCKCAVKPHDCGNKTRWKSVPG